MVLPGGSYPEKMQALQPSIMHVFACALVMTFLSRRMHTPHTALQWLPGWASAA